MSRASAKWRKKSGAATAQKHETAKRGRTDCVSRGLVSHLYARARVCAQGHACVCERSRQSVSCSSQALCTSSFDWFLRCVAARKPMAYLFRLPADVTTLVNKFEGTLSQSRPRRHPERARRQSRIGKSSTRPRRIHRIGPRGDGCARVARVARPWVRLGFGLVRHLAPAPKQYLPSMLCGSRRRARCCRCAATPWLPSLVKALQGADSIDRPSHLFDAVCLWVEDRLGPRGYPQTIRLETGMPYATRRGLEELAPQVARIISDTAFHM